MLDVTTGVKFLDAATLSKLAALCPPGTRLTVNQVGNLLMTNEHGESIGYIDFNGEEVVFFNA